MKITIKLLPTSAVCVDPSFNEWSEAVNDSIMKRVRAPWIIGDLMNYGDLRFGERYAQAIDGCVVQYHTLQNWRWVCRQFEASRRRESLSWSHHETVAMWDVDHQEKWLALAESKRLSVHELRDAVRETKGKREVVIDERFVSDFKQWVDETIARNFLLKEIKRGAMEVVGFDKQKHIPLVRPKAKVA